MLACCPAREELEKALQGLAPEQITGRGGLLTQLAGREIETALGAELTEHLGFRPAKRRGWRGNHRNGATAKTVQTELGPMAFRSSATPSAGSPTRSWPTSSAWRTRPLEAVYNPRLGISRPVRRSASVGETS